MKDNDISAFGSNRRRFVKTALGVMAATCLPLPGIAVAKTKAGLIQKIIPSTGEKIAPIGMGSWMTFNVGNDNAARKNCTNVLRAFFDGGGQMIDSSPMYGSSEEVIGHCLAQLKMPKHFSATKIWTPFQATGVSQARESEQLWGTQVIDLQQVHNLVSWEEHLATMKGLKKDKRIRYLGISTSHGRRHDALEKIMRTEDIDFVQLTYNILNTEVEKRLLPLAMEKGIAVIANRPFQRKGLFHRFGSKPLPAWAAEIGCHNWAQYFLKFIISHPAITCAIPATSQVAHMKENMAAQTGVLPDAATRAKMQAYLQTI